MNNDTEINSRVPVTGYALKVLEPYPAEAGRTVLRGRKLPGWVY
jgi:hypothetical protein